MKKQNIEHFTSEKKNNNTCFEFDTPSNETLFQPSIFRSIFVFLFFAVVFLWSTCFGLIIRINTVKKWLLNTHWNCFLLFCLHIEIFSAPHPRWIWLWPLSLTHSLVRSLLTVHFNWESVAFNETNSIPTNIFMTY